MKWVQFEPGGSRQLNSASMSSKKDEFQENFDRIEQDLKNNEAYQSFFQKYQEKSVDSFIYSYAHNKAMLITYGSHVQNSRESAMEEWQKGAWTALQEIQHKNTPPGMGLEFVEISTIDKKAVESYITNFLKKIRQKRTT